MFYQKICDKSAVVSVVLSYFLSCVADIYIYIYMYNDMYIYTHSTYVIIYIHR